jgi:hypothetical protein
MSNTENERLSVKVEVVCVMGEIALHVGDARIELTSAQATELAELLEEAVEFSR